jgi:lipopolysaccharide export system protein LptA
MFKSSLFLFLSLLCVFNFEAQNKTKIVAPSNTIKGSILIPDTSKGPKKIVLERAGTLKRDVNIANGAKRLSGAVQFSHDGVIMDCDSAYFFDNNTLEAFEHITIRQGDSITITGKHLYYDGNTKIATLEGDLSGKPNVQEVICIEKDMTLTTKVLNYDVSQSLASYLTGGKIVNKQNTLTSQHGYYHSPTKEVSFKNDVKLKNEKYDMESDTLRYNTQTKISYFLGPSIIKSKENFIYCENGYYDTEKEDSRFSKNAVIVHDNNKLTGDSVVYNRKEGIGLALNNIKLYDLVENVMIEGHKAEYFEKIGSARVTENAIFRKDVDGDTLSILADTLMQIDKKLFNAAKYDSLTIGEQGDSIMVKRLNIDTALKDTLLIRTIKAYRKVRFYKSTMAGICDSLSIVNTDSIIKMYRAPMLWKDSTQITASRIQVTVGKKAVKGFMTEDNSLVVMMQDSLYFNQLKGRNIVGNYSKDDTLRSIKVNGNAQTVYYMKEEKKFVGVNKTDCTEILARFKKGEMDKINFINKPVSEIIPIREVVPAQVNLKEFVWLPEKRPLKKDFVFVKREKPVKAKVVKPKTVKKPKKKKS